MKVKVPGAESSTGVKPVDFTLPKGDYVLEFAVATPKESANSPCMVHTFPSVVIDGPEDEKTGRSTQGRKYMHRIIQLLPEHESYRDGDTRAADEIADLCAAAGVDIDDDGYDPEEFAGKRAKVTLGIRMGKGQDGEPRPENTVRQVKDEDGHVHLFLADDGRPTGPAKKASPKASASKRR
jgi:hypothetical protein